MTALVELDSLAALRLQLEWGADEALADAPVDWLHAAPAPAVADAPRRVLARAEPVALRPAPAPASINVDAGSLEALHDALRAFTGCPLRATATHTVRPSGNPASGLLLVGEAPSADDDRTGHAFSGQPGQVLDRVLGSAGLDRTRVFLTTLVPWRPPGSRPPTEAEVQACLPFLMRLIALVQPARIVLLGAGPVRAFLGASDGVRKLRGKWQDAVVNGTVLPALPMLPLDQWLRSPTAKRDTWTDLLTLRAALER